MWRKCALAVVCSFVVAMAGIPASPAYAAAPVFRAGVAANSTTTSASVTVPGVGAAR